ncbi:Succinyl-diaminopimelate desuccinylase [bacterium HR26]|nr:Succinyl-diaminopimelate desuccinylase [bacterium HR26]
MIGYDEAIDRAVAQRASEAFDLLRQLIACPSLSLAEGRHDRPETAVGAMATALARLGLPVTALPTGPESETLIARWGRPHPAGPAVILDAHLDTVPPGDPAAWLGLDPLAAHEGVATYLGDGQVRLSFPAAGVAVERRLRPRMARVWEARGGGERAVIGGRGAFDNKGPAAVLWLTLAALCDCFGAGGLDGSQVLGIFSTDEEQGERGIRAALGWLARQGYLDRPLAAVGYRQGLAAIVLEGSYSYLPVVGHRGSALLVLRTRGRAAHAATPELGDNAVLRMARLLARLEADWPAFRARSLDPLLPDRLLEPATVALGTTMAGGGVVRVDTGPEGPLVERAGTNVVPDWCEATLDLRYPRGVGAPEALVEAITRAIADWVQEHEPAATVRLLRWSSPAALGETPGAALADPLVQAVVGAREAVLGLPSYPETAPGGTNGTVLLNEGRIRTLIECGPGGGLSHEPFEFVDRDDLVDGARILVRALLAILDALAGR